MLVDIKIQASKSKMIPDTAYYKANLTFENGKQVVLELHNTEYNTLKAAGVIPDGE